jgi:hypothetical protein
MLLDVCARKYRMNRHLRLDFLAFCPKGLLHLRFRAFVPYCIETLGNYGQAESD